MGGSQDKMTIHQSCEENIEQISSTPELIISFVFDEGHSFADIYWCFDRVMQFGVKYLYQVTKDMATLKAEICQKLNVDGPANSQKNAVHQTDQMIREQLEQAYEEEKAKSVIVKKCTRIYHELLKGRDKILYEHLMNNQVSPELQLMRWLRCVLTREFDTDTVLIHWDFILGGAYLQHTKHRQHLFAEPSKDKGRISEPFPAREVDPFLNLDIMCVSMIVSIKEILMESDFSMCLAYLLSYEPPEDTSSLVIEAIDIKKRLCLNEVGKEEEKEVDSMFDFLDSFGENAP